MRNCFDNIKTNGYLLIEIQTEELPPKALLKLAANFQNDVVERLKKLNFT